MSKWSLFGWKHSRYRWYYLATTGPVTLATFALVPGSSTAWVAFLLMTVCWFVVDRLT